MWDNWFHLAYSWYQKFNDHAGDLYPGRYTWDRCVELAKMAVEIRAKAKEKNSVIFAHNYLYPEMHEIADKVGDSLGLALHARAIGAKRIDFESVFFMGATAKIINGDKTRVFVPDKPSVIGCSLVFGTDYEWIENWKDETGGVLVTYINSDAYTKSISEFISTSRNTDKVIKAASEMYAGKPILVLPDKFLGHVMKKRAEALGVNPRLIHIYDRPKGEWRACCYVHELIGMDAMDVALLEHPEAELMIHPECGCASLCMLKIQNGEIPHEKAFSLSTEQMVERAKISPAKEFIVATEKGMIYRLRKEIPEKTFIPVSQRAECGFMKASILEKLLDSLNTDRLEIVLCDDCCDPKDPYENDTEVHIQRSVAEKAKLGIERMLAIR